jgi:hypothetical protein
MMNTTGCSSGVSVCVGDGLAGWGGGIRTSASESRSVCGILHGAMALSRRLSERAAGADPR